MKFRCEREVLADALATAGRATSRTGTLQVLSGLRLEVVGGELSVTGTDLELSIRLTVAVAGDRDGAVVVPRLAADIVRSLPAGSVEVWATDDEVSISAGRSQFSVRSWNVDDYPVQSEPAVDAVTLPAASVAEALRQVVRAASPDDTRPLLSGVLLIAEDDGVRMVATDSYRLAVRELAETHVLSAGQKVVVPSRALNELQRVLGDNDELQVRLGARDAVFESGGMRLTTRLIEGDYPNYRSLLPPTDENKLTVGREALVGALRRVKIMASDSHLVRLKLGGETLELSATQDVGNASEEIDAVYDGEDMTVAFNPDYLAAGIDAIDAEEITISRLHPLKPAVIRAVGRDDYLYLLMPVRVP